MRDYQNELIDSPAKDDFTISAPQIGKTVSLEVWFLKQMWLAGPLPWPWWWAAPTYQQSRRGFLEWCELADSARVLKTATTSVPLRATLINGARSEARSWERPKYLQGDPVAGMGIDEFGLLTADAWKTMSARRSETIIHGYGQCRGIGNVPVDLTGVARKLWDRAESGARGTACRRWTWVHRANALPCSCSPTPFTQLGMGERHGEDCPRGVYVRHVENEADTLSKGEFLQLYLAEWADVNELPVYDFTRDDNTRTDLVLDPHLPIELSVDFNVDPMCWVIGQHKGEYAWAVAEIVIPGGARTVEACREFRRLVPPNPRLEVHVFGDATGKARDTRSKLDDYKIIRQELEEHYGVFRLRVPSSNPPVLERVNVCNARFRTATGRVRYWAHPRCERLINDWIKVSWRPGTRDIDDRDKTMTHLSSAEGYRLHTLYPKRAGKVIIGSEQEWRSGWRSRDRDTSLLEMDF